MHNGKSAAEQAAEMAAVLITGQVRDIEPVITVMEAGKKHVLPVAEMVICKGRQAELLISNYAEAAYNEELTVRPYETKVYYYIIRSNGIKNSALLCRKKTAGRALFYQLNAHGSI